MHSLFLTIANPVKWRNVGRLLVVVLLAVSPTKGAKAEAVRISEETKKAHRLLAALEQKSEELQHKLSFEDALEVHRQIIALVKVHDSYKLKQTLAEEASLQRRVSLSPAQQQKFRRAGELRSQSAAALLKQDDFVTARRLHAEIVALLEEILGKDDYFVLLTQLELGPNAK